VNFLGKGKEFPVTVQLDSFLRGVKHRMTMMALGQVGFEGMLQFLVQLAIQVVGDLVDSLLAG
jgi:hypothetical protein